MAVTRAWVSPRVKRAEPCVRGRRPTSQEIGRTVELEDVLRPVLRRVVVGIVGNDLEEAVKEDRRDACVDEAGMVAFDRQCSLHDIVQTALVRLGSGEVGDAGRAGEEPL